MKLRIPVILTTALFFAAGLGFFVTGCATSFGSKELLGHVKVPKRMDSRLAAVNLGVVETEVTKEAKLALDREARRLESQEVICVGNPWSDELDPENVEKSVKYMLTKRFGSVDFYDSEADAFNCGADMVLVLDIRPKPADGILNFVSIIDIDATMVDWNGNVIDTFKGEAKGPAPFFPSSPGFLPVLTEAVNEVGQGIDQSRKLKKFVDNMLTDMPEGPSFSPE
jgi:hypothetical protein